MVKKIPFFLLIIINVFVANIAFAYSEDIEAIGQEIGGGGGRLDWPVPTPPAVMTSAFGYRVHPITGNVRHHGGVDLAGDFGDLIYAAGDGVVEDASIGYNGGYGNLVIIDHGNGLKTYYGHNSTVDVYPNHGVNGSFYWPALSLWNRVKRTIRRPGAVCVRYGANGNGAVWQPCRWR